MAYASCFQGYRSDCFRDMSKKPFLVTPMPNILNNRSSYLAKLGIQGIQDTQGIFGKLGGFSKIQPTCCGAIFFIVCRGTQKYEVLRRGWATEIGDVKIGGGGALWGF